MEIVDLEDKEILRALKISIPKFRHEVIWSGKSKHQVFRMMLCEKLDKETNRP